MDSNTDATDVVVAFDLYGTLLDTASIADKLEAHVGQAKSGTIAAAWRTYQLEYTWRFNSMNKYEPFSSLTLRALQHALREAQVTLEQAALDDIIKAYDALNTFPDVAPALLKLANTTGMTPVVFSNGTQSMVASSIARSPDLSPHAALFRQLVVVDDVKRYKPAPEVYQLLAQKCGREPGDIWVVSSNPFDVVGASSFGMRTVWVDRGGGGWTDRLLEGEAGAPTAIVGRLEDVVDAVTTNVTSGKSTSSS